MSTKVLPVGKLPLVCLRKKKTKPECLNLCSNQSKALKCEFEGRPVPYRGEKTGYGDIKQLVTTEMGLLGVDAYEGEMEIS